LTKTNYIVVGYPPIAGFTADKAGGSAPLLVTFTDTTTNKPTAWSWDFGDPGSGVSNNTSTLKNPTHTYNSAGSFTVKLTATNALGSSTYTQTTPITVTQSDVTVTRNPIADSYVSSSSLTGNYGTATTMKVREGDGSSANPNYRSYLKFDVTGVGTVSAITLRLWVTDASVNLQSVFVVSDNTWTETGITYTNAPAISGSAAGTTTAAPAAAYVTITLSPTALAPATTNFTLAIKGNGTDSFIVSTREDATHKPELTYTYH
jgi:PKD repeat protein